MRSHSASVVASIGALEATPAFDTTTSTPPNAPTATANASLTASSSVTSPPTAAPASPKLATASDAPSSSRSKATTHAPFAASSSTTARPMPPAAPVTSATRPCNSPGGGRNDSLYNSRGQYSTAKLSSSVRDVKPPSA